MRLACDLSLLKRTQPHDYILRFLFGGAVTVATGLLAQRYGAVFGGLFLAFPAIFPAAATLIEKHERERSRRSGNVPTLRGRKAAALDARGAAMGSIGLAAFAVVVWKLLPLWNPWICLAAAFAAWLATSILVWRLSKIRHSRRRAI